MIKTEDIKDISNFCPNFKRLFLWNESMKIIKSFLTQHPFPIRISFHKGQRPNVHRKEFGILKRAYTSQIIRLCFGWGDLLIGPCDIYFFNAQTFDFFHPTVAKSFQQILIHWRCRIEKVLVGNIVTRMGTSFSEYWLSHQESEEAFLE